MRRNSALTLMCAMSVRDEQTNLSCRGSVGSPSEIVERMRAECLSRLIDSLRLQASFVAPTGRASAADILRDIRVQKQ